MENAPRLLKLLTLFNTIFSNDVLVYMKKAGSMNFGMKSKVWIVYSIFQTKYYTKNV